MASALTLEQLDWYASLLESGWELVPDVELFGAGNLRAGEPPVTREQISSIVRNFSAFSAGKSPRLTVPIGPGHEDRTDQPALGRVVAVRERPGAVLEADLLLPPPLARIVRAGGYYAVSVEVSDDPPDGLPGAGMTLTGLALLGATQPQLKWLRHLPNAANFSARRRGRFASRRPAPGRRVFSEVYAVDQATKDTLLAVIQGKWPDLPEEFLSGLQDDQLQALAAAAAPAGGGGGTTAAAAPDRATMIEQILAADPSQDRSALEGMDDASLMQLWQQLTGQTAASEFAAADEGDTVPPTPPTPPAPRPAPTVPPPTPQPPAPAPAPTPRQFAALAERSARIEANLRRLEAQTKARQYAEQTAEVRAIVAEAVRDGRLTPADADEQQATPAAHRVPNEFLNGVQASRTRRYAGTGLSEFDAWRKRIAALPRRKAGGRAYGEQVVTPAAGKSRVEQIREATRDHYAKKASGPSLEDRLGMVRPAGLR